MKYFDILTSRKYKYHYKILQLQLSMKILLQEKTFQLISPSQVLPQASLFLCLYSTPPFSLSAAAVDSKLKHSKFLV